MQITIPASIEEAQTELNSDWQLITAKEWRRAAIVYAFTTDQDKGGRPSREQPVGNPTGLLTIGAFVRLGFHGLTTRESVGNYRKAWQSAMDDYMAPVPQPGMSIEIGAEWTWPPTGVASVNSMTRLRQALIEDPAGTVGKIIKEAPEATAALARGVAAHPQVAALVVREAQDQIRDFVPRGDVPEPDYSREFRGAVDRMLRCLDAMRAGRWEPDTLERTLAHFMASAWTEATGEQPNYSVIDEIEAFLATSRASSDA